MIEKVSKINSDNSDSNKQFRDWLSPQGKFLFGKHEGESLETVVILDYSYVSWAVENAENMSEEDRGIMRSHLSYIGRGER